MDININTRNVYQFIKKINYIIFLIGYIISCSIIMVVFDLCNSIFVISDIMVRFEIGVPIIMQLILTYFVYRENSKAKMIKILLLMVLFYALLCAALSLYELYFTYSSFGIDLIYYVSIAQIAFQFILVILLLICMLARLVSKLIVIRSLLMAAFNMIIVILLQFGGEVSDNSFVSWLIAATLFINTFNPILLYILSNTAKGKLFAKDSLQERNMTLPGS